MSTKSYIVSTGDGDGGFYVACGDTADPGFMKTLEGKEYFEDDPDTPLVEDDPGSYFMRAYEMHEGKIIINMEKAKKGYLDWLKGIRTEKLEELDTEQIKALGELNFDKIKEIEDTKKSLRDLPELIDWDSIETVYDLIHIFPPILQ